MAKIKTRYAKYNKLWYENNLPTSQIGITRIQKMLKLIDIEDNMKILDIGCGTGELAKILTANKKIYVYGVDIMKKFIDEIKKHNIMTEAKVCDVDNGIPYKDKFFDILFAGEIIEHVSDADYFLDECFRLLKNDGSLCYQRQIYCHLGIGLICFSG